MHRCAEHGLRVNEEGLTLDPDIVDDRLLKLAQFTGNPYVDAKFVFLFGTVLTPEEGEKRRKDRLVYLGRYMRQPMSAFENMPVEDIKQYMRLTSHLVGRENPSATTPSETDYT